MPFIQGTPGGGGTSTPTGGPVVMRIEPSQVLALKADLESVRDAVQTFLRDNGEALIARPVARDEVSRDAASDFADNANTALKVAQQFTAELARTVKGLDAAVRQYELDDDTGRGTIRASVRRT